MCIRLDKAYHNMQMHSNYYDKSNILLSYRAMLICYAYYIANNFLQLSHELSQLSPCIVRNQCTSLICSILITRRSLKSSDQGSLVVPRSWVKSGGFNTSSCRLDILQSLLKPLKCSWRPIYLSCLALFHCCFHFFQFALVKNFVTLLYESCYTK